MPRLIILLLPLVAIATCGMSQTEITWKTLGDIRFFFYYSVEEEADYYYPHFGSSVKALEGKEVYLKGYMLAIDPKEGYYLLSRNPMAACFFCGNGGPETVVELKLKPGHRRFKMDQVVTITGRLKLNSEDVYQCNYIFEDAELYKPD